MPRNFFRKYLPSDESVREQPLLRPVRHLLHRPQIWHLHRRSVAGACFIGMFVAFVPLPGQMLIAAALAIVSRCNLPLSVALVWVTNPLTMGPMFFFAYALGAWLLGADLVTDAPEMSWQWFQAQFWLIWQPLLVGCLVCRWVSGLPLMVLARVGWRMHVVRRWRHRARERQSHNTQAQAG